MKIFSWLSRDLDIHHKISEWERTNYKNFPFSSSYSHRQDVFIFLGRVEGQNELNDFTYKCGWCRRLTGKEALVSSVTKTNPNLLKILRVRKRIFSGIEVCCQRSGDGMWWIKEVHEWIDGNTSGRQRGKMQVRFRKLMLSVDSINLSWACWGSWGMKAEAKWCLQLTLIRDELRSWSNFSLETKNMKYDTRIFVTLSHLIFRNERFISKNARVESDKFFTRQHWRVWVNSCCSFPKFSSKISRKPFSDSSESSFL